jgi:hypothetical protein
MAAAICLALEERARATAGVWEAGGADLALRPRPVVPIYSGDLGGVTAQDGSDCAGDLSDLKARIALMFAFGAGWSPTRWGRTSSASVPMTRSRSREAAFEANL